MVRKIVVALILIVGLVNTSCTSVEELNESTMYRGLVTTIPFRLYGSMIIVELSVDGSDPLDFIFDSASGGTVISARTADGLGIVGEETVSRQGAAGDATILLSEDHVLNIGDLTLPDVTIGIAELDHIQRRLGMRFDGVIGWRILSQYAVKLDYDLMQIGIYDTNRFDYRLNAQSYDVKVNGTVFFVNATVHFENGADYTGLVLVDTGSAGNISFNTTFSTENDLLAKVGSSYEREAMAGLSQDSYQIITTILSSLSVGGYEFVSIPANIAFAEEGALSWSGPMGILGNEILTRFNMFIDLQQERLYLEDNRLYQEAFEVNCSGLELVMDETLERAMVDYVYPASPAVESSMRVGDEIVRISGVSASDLTLPQMQSVLSQDGQEVEIVVNRGGEFYTYLLRLQQLIGPQEGN